MIKKIKMFSYLIGFVILFISFSCGESSQNPKQEEIDAIIKKGEEAKKNWNYSDPSEYFKAMVGLQTEIGQLLVQIRWDNGTNEVRNQMTNLSEEVGKNLLVVKKMTLTKNDYGIKVALIELFEFYNDLAILYIPNMCDAMDKMEETNDESLTLKYYQEMIEIQNDVSTIEGSLDKNFEVAQNAFSSAYGFELKENPLQDAVDNM